MKEHEARLLQIATSNGGFSIGEENGKRGYMLTFVIAYIRVRHRATVMQIGAAVWFRSHG